MKQCRLHRDGVNTVAWIDERGAHVGAEVELLVKPQPEWWKVVEVFNFAMEAAALEAHNQLNRNSLPSLVGAKG